MTELRPLSQPEGRSAAPTPRFFRGFVRFQGVARRKFPFLNCSFVILTARQPESRTVSRAVYHILWVRDFRANTISRRGFNLFKELRRHFPATSFCRQPRRESPR